MLPIAAEESGRSTLSRLVNVGKLHYTRHSTEPSSTAGMADNRTDATIALTGCSCTKPNFKLVLPMEAEQLPLMEADGASSPRGAGLAVVGDDSYYSNKIEGQHT
ncbi:MAG: hypothetical protein WAW10_07240 [Gallionella sp.]